jgi:hypothetical protein
MCSTSFEMMRTYGSCGIFEVGKVRVKAFEPDVLYVLPFSQRDHVWSTPTAAAEWNLTRWHNANFRADVLLTSPANLDQRADAPSWRRIEPGIVVECMCTSSDCCSAGARVLLNLGFRSTHGEPYFIAARCPACSDLTLQGKVLRCFVNQACGTLGDGSSFVAQRELLQVDKTRPLRVRPLKCVLCMKPMYKNTFMCQPCASYRTGWHDLFDAPLTLRSGASYVHSSAWPGLRTRRTSAT